MVLQTCSPVITPKIMPVVIRYGFIESQSNDAIAVTGRRAVIMASQGFMAKRLIFICATISSLVEIPISNHVVNHLHRRKNSLAAEFVHVKGLLTTGPGTIVHGPARAAACCKINPPRLQVSVIAWLETRMPNCGGDASGTVETKEEPNVMAVACALSK